MDDALPATEDSGRPYGIILLTILFGLATLVGVLGAVFTAGAPLPVRFLFGMYGVNSAAAAYGLWWERRWGWNLAIVLMALSLAFDVFVLPFALSRSPSLMRIILGVGILGYLYSVRDLFGGAK